MEIEFEIQPQALPDVSAFSYPLIPAPMSQGTKCSQRGCF